MKRIVCLLLGGVFTIGGKAQAEDQTVTVPERREGVTAGRTAQNDTPSVRLRELPARRASGAGEPSVDVLCKAAVTLALAEPERARGFINRARLAGWLPEIHFRVYRRFARTEGLTFADMGTTGTAAPVDVSAVDDVRYEWRASWDLSRMVFNPDELQAHFEALRMADVRRDIQSVVIKLYFERRRLLSGAEPSPTAVNGGAEAEVQMQMQMDEKRRLRVAEIEAQLDAVSGGAFSAGVPEGHQAAASP